MFDFSDLTISNYQGFTWQASQGKTGLSTLDLVYPANGWQSLKEVAVKDSGPSCPFLPSLSIWRSPYSENFPLWLNTQYFSTPTPQSNPQLHKSAGAFCIVFKFYFKKQQQKPSKNNSTPTSFMETSRPPCLCQSIDYQPTCHSMGVMEQRESVLTPRLDSCLCNCN